MTINELASLIAKREGKKYQARIGDVREILKILATLEAEDCLANPGGIEGPLISLTKYSDKILTKLHDKAQRPRKAK